MKIVFSQYTGTRIHAKDLNIYLASFVVTPSEPHENVDRRSETQF